MKQAISIKLTMKEPSGENKAAAVESLLVVIHECASRWARDVQAPPPARHDPESFIASSIVFGKDGVEVDVEMKPEAIDIFAPETAFDTPKNMLKFIQQSGGRTSAIQRLAFRALTAVASESGMAETRRRMRSMAFEALKTRCMTSIHASLIPMIMAAALAVDSDLNTGEPSAIKPSKSPRQTAQ